MGKSPQQSGQPTLVNKTKYSLVRYLDIMHHNQKKCKEKKGEKIKKHSIKQKEWKPNEQSNITTISRK